MAFNTLQLTDGSRAVLKGDRVRLRESAQLACSRRRSGTAKAALAVAAGAARSRTRFAALNAWRAEIARRQNLPAHVVFPRRHASEMVARRPQTLGELAHVSGVGERANFSRLTARPSPSSAARGGDGAEAEAATGSTGTDAAGGRPRSRRCR